MKNAVVVPHAGIPLSRECRNSVERYCQRFGLAAVFLPHVKIKARGHGRYAYGRFEKFQAQSVFQEFERILLLDSDTLITDLAPNVFDIVAPEKLGVVREDVLNITANRQREIRAVQNVMGNLDWHEALFNSGVIVASRQHQALWNNDSELAHALASKKLGRHKEQKIVNWRARKLGFDIEWLDPRWNYLRMYERDQKLPRTQAYIIHYAGRSNRTQKQAIDGRILTSRHYYDDRCQMRRSQVEWMLRQGGQRFAGPVLFFGSGFDSRMWSELCDVTFLENSVRWYRKLFDDPRNQAIKAYLVNYKTQVQDWQRDLENHVLNTLPPEVDRRRYDVIIVDGPRGSRPTSPGRVSSILHARRLLKPGGAIFVDDIGRTLEKNVTNIVFGKPTAIHRGRSRIGYWSLK